MDRESTGAEETGIFALDKHDTILRFCVGAKVKHLLRTLPPGTAAIAFHRLHNDLLNSHLNASSPLFDHHPAQTVQLTSPHLDARGVAALPLGLGGHGFTPSSHPPLPATVSNASPTNPNSTDVTATHHHGAFYASCSAFWSLIRAWVPLLRDEFLPSLSDPITSDPPPYKTQIRDTWLRINASSARLKLHPERKHLPAHHRRPAYFDPLLDGENEPVPDMPSTPQTPSGPSTLIPQPSLPPHSSKSPQLSIP